MKAPGGNGRAATPSSGPSAVPDEGPGGSRAALLAWRSLDAAGHSGSSELPTVLALESSPDFVVTSSIEALTRRAMRYLETRHAIHLCGPAGTGKTAFAMHLAARLGRPAVLVHGDEEYNTSDFVGSETGYDRSRVVDNFIHSVLKTEESLRRRWVDNRLTMACKYGYVLVYDEFTRSRPEANNVLLSVLGERLLDMPKVAAGESYVRVHPDFAAIFTSNPEEYAGVYSSQDALLDRMVTLEMTGHDVETEVDIVSARSGLAREESHRIVRLARHMRDRGMVPHRSTLRGALIVGKVLRRSGARAVASDTVFLETCVDVFGSPPSNRNESPRLNLGDILLALQECLPEATEGRSGPCRSK